MATIDSGGGSHGRKQVDHEIPLVPFIDLLLCCVMFLLVTAVWAQLGSMGATTPGGSDAPSTDEVRELVLTLSNDQLVVASSVGGESTVGIVDGAQLDAPALARTLARHRIEEGGVVAVKLLPDDDVNAALVVATMDVLRGEGYAAIGFPSAAGG